MVILKSKSMRGVEVATVLCLALLALPLNCKGWVEEAISNKEQIAHIFFL